MLQLPLTFTLDQTVSFPSLPPRYPRLLTFSVGELTSLHSRHSYWYTAVTLRKTLEENHVGMGLLTILTFGAGYFLEEHLALSQPDFLPAPPSCKPTEQIFWRWEKSRSDLSTLAPFSPKLAETPVGRQRKGCHNWEFLACCVARRESTQQCGQTWLAVGALGHED